MKKEKQCPTSCAKKTSIGGQALMEGIMMRGPETTAMAVRNTQGEIVIESFPTTTKKRAKILKWPVIRGVFNYIDSMVLGMKCLTRSAEISGLEEAEEELRKEKEAKKAAKAAKKAAKKGINTEKVVEEEIAETSSVEVEPTLKTEADDACVQDPSEKKEAKKESSALMGTVLFFGVALGIVFSIALFIIVPSYLYKGAVYLIPALKHPDPAVNSLIKSVFEGVLKIFILIGYMAAISLMKDIKRTFMYHGAEHKTIACFEAGEELTPENAMKHTRFHPRCGTSFMFFMILLGIVAGLLVNAVFPGLNKWQYTGIRLLILPLIVGLGYEFIMYAGKHNNIFVRALSAPGLWVQRLTTKEPTPDMLEVAIVSTKCALRDEFPEYLEYFESRGWEVKPDCEDGENAQIGNDGEGADEGADGQGVILAEEAENGTETAETAENGGENIDNEAADTSEKSDSDTESGDSVSAE